MFQTARGVAAAFGLLMLWVVPAPGAIRYVKQGAAGAGDGASWTDAYPDLGAGLSAAVSGDQVWVAAGEYKPAGPGGSRSATFTLPMGVTLLGGFPGLPGQEADASVRDPKAYVTVLSGDLNGDDNPPLGNRGDNAYHVVTIADSDANTKIDGFVVRCGQADGATTNDKYAGAILISVNVNTPLTISWCVFLDNTSSLEGGAIRGPANITGCRFARNRSQYGGAAALSGQITDSEFNNNICTSAGGAVYLYSGKITLSLFVKNLSKKAGGAVYLDGARSSIESSTLQENTALADYLFSTDVEDDGGGAIWAPYGGEVIGCRILRNESLTSGGGILGQPRVKNCIVAENRARDAGGGLSFPWSGAIQNCTIVDNTAGSGGGVYFHYVGASSLVNSIVWNNKAIAGAQIHSKSAPLPTYSAIEGGPAGVYPPPLGIWPATNTAADPLLAIDYRLKTGSPAIDAGTPTPVGGLTVTDIQGRPRSVDGNADGTALPDLGAFEFEPGQSAVSVREALLMVHALESGQPVHERLHLQQVNGSGVSFSVSSSVPWIHITPNNGVLSTLEQEVIVTIDPAALAYGEYRAEIEVNSPEAVNSPVRVPILVTVNRVFTVPSVYGTIQAGVDAAYLPGDVVSLASGVFSGPGNQAVDLKGKSITVQSPQLNPAELIPSTGGAFIAQSQERASLENIRIRANNSVNATPMIQIGASELKLDRCEITALVGSTTQNGLATASDGILRLIQCDFRGSGGSGVYAVRADIAIVGCRMANCGNAVYLNKSGARVFNSTLYANASGISGAWPSDGSGYIHVANSCVTMNSGIGVSSMVNLLIENSLIWGNATTASTNQVHTSVWSGSNHLARIHHCIIERGANGITASASTPLILGPQIIDEPPIFRDIDGTMNSLFYLLTRDYRLTPCSPGVDAGDNGALPRDEFDLDDDGDTREPMPLDLAGQPRRVDLPELADTGAGVAPIVDIGAYETVPSEQVEFCRAVSRKDHAAAGTFDVDLNLNATSRATVEPRLGGATRLVLTFTHPLLPIDGVFDANNLQVLGGAQPTATALDGATATIDLVAVPDKSCVCVTLLDMKDEAGTALPPLWTCVRNAYGDASNDGSVNLGDALTAKGFVGKPLTGSTARYDVNLTGQINVGDLLAIKAQASSTPAAQCP